MRLGPVAEVEARSIATSNAVVLAETALLAPAPASTMLKSVRQVILSFMVSLDYRSLARPCFLLSALTPAQQPRSGSRSIVAILRAAAPAGIREFPHSKHTPVAMIPPDGITRLPQGWTWSPPHHLRAGWRRWRLDSVGLFEAARDRDMYQTRPLRAA